jgi:predicted phosphodiesterase
VRLAIISDIHEDYDSLRKVVEKAEARGFEKLICLGDISGFNPLYYTYGEYRNAPACLALLREKCHIIIAGNHDIHASGRDPELHESIKDRDAWQHEEDLDPGYGEEDIGFLASLPFYETLSTPAGKILFSHYVYPNLSGFVKGFYSRSREFREHFSFMRQQDCALAFSGHAHPDGFYRVYSRGFRLFRKREITISSFPALIGIPPASRHEHRSSFCIFDTISLRLQIIK